MEEVKIIPCLDIKDGRVVKGVNFVNLRDARDPVEAAQAYCREGADELVFLDIFLVRSISLYAQQLLREYTLML